MEHSSIIRFMGRALLMDVGMSVQYFLTNLGIQNAICCVPKGPKGKDHKKQIM